MGHYTYENTGLYTRNAELILSNFIPDFSITGPGPSRFNLPTGTTGKILTLRAQEVIRSLNKTIMDLKMLPDHATLTMWTTYHKDTPAEYVSLVGFCITITSELVRIDLPYFPVFKKPSYTRDPLILKAHFHDGENTFLCKSWSVIHRACILPSISGPDPFSPSFKWAFSQKFWKLLTYQY